MVELAPAADFLSRVEFLFIISIDANILINITGKSMLPERK